MRCAALSRSPPPPVEPLGFFFLFLFLLFLLFSSFQSLGTAAKPPAWSSICLWLPEWQAASQSITNTDQYTLLSLSTSSSLSPPSSSFILFSISLFSPPLPCVWHQRMALFMSNRYWSRHTNKALPSISDVIEGFDSKYAEQLETLAVWFHCRGSSVDSKSKSNMF